MDNRRFMLIAVVGVILFFMYQAWQKDYAPKPQSQPTSPTSSSDLPHVAGVPVDSVASAPSASQRVIVFTDTMRVEISAEGGDLRRLELVGVPISKELGEQNLYLLNDQTPNFFILQSGLIAAEGTAPDHRAVYGAGQAEYRLAEGLDRLEVPLTWREDGREVVKTYVFKRNSYEIELRQTARNSRDAPWQLSPYVRFWRTPFSQSEDPPFVQTFIGVGWYERKNGGERYRFSKLSFEDLDDDALRAQQTGGWVAMLQHYFMAAAIPSGEGLNSYFAKPKALPDSPAPAYEAGYVGPQQLVAARGEKTFSTQLYIGPKLQDRLETIAPGFELAMDYGILTVLAEPLFWVLEKFHKLTGNWGWAIVLLTIAVKLVMWKLTEAQYRSMARMKKFAPRMQALKERYADDREGMQKAMMDLYKKEGFNPLGGCWPLLVQFPVFIALYWVLLESVELRQAPFILWIQDMSAPDPFYITPVLFGVSMWFQQKLSGSTMTMDPAQQRIMNIMPIALTAFFAFFPAGLVVYWLVSNMIGIGQQWWITRKLEREGTPKVKTA
ncbi:MAG: membrane protein insertase YidC [Nevskiales bacterium]